jgi:hypothetical protein
VAKYFELDDLYRFLTPKNNGDQISTEAKTPEDKIIETIFPPKGVHLTFSEIVSRLEESPKFHAVGPDKFLDPEGKYWKDVKTSGVGMRGILRPTGNTEKIAAFVIRDPGVSPTVAGVDKIGRFLNYTPTLVVSQMVPYLDVEFSFSNVNSTTKTPGIIRFLLGSESNSSLSPGDKALDARRKQKDREGTETESGVSGMEMFLMPQTLTNMDNLYETKRGDSLIRLLPPKPFVPMASIEGFDITVQNAGAGSFASKRGNLKFKIHDKSRVSEFSDFLRGSSGAAFMRVTTTFGWHAPDAREDEDEFYKFINTYMKQTDTWAVVNTQFAFDASGQVNIGVQLASDPTTNRDPVMIVSDESPRLIALSKRHDEISSATADIVGKDSHQSTNGAKTEQLGNYKTFVEILKMASSAGYVKLSDGKIVDEALINKLFSDEHVIRRISSAGLVSDRLKNLLVGLLPKRSGGQQNTESDAYVQNEVLTSIGKSLFDTIYATPDPFLPREGLDFHPALVKLVQDYKKPVASGNKKP